MSVMRRFIGSSGSSPSTSHRFSCSFSMGPFLSTCHCPFFIVLRVVLPWPHRMRFSVSPPMRERLGEYGGFHRSAGNEWCHFLGIPSIVAGAGTLLSLVPLAHVAGFQLTLAEVVA